MLHKLVEYADSHGIGEEGFISKRIRFLFQFSPQGKYLSLHDYGKNGSAFSDVPHLQFAGDSYKRQFLVDTVDFLTLCHWTFEAFKKTTGKLLTTLKEEDDFEEIKSFSEKILSLLAERKYTELQEIGSTEKWTKILKRDGRETTEIESFLKEGGEVEKLFSAHPEMAIF